MKAKKEVGVEAAIKGCLEVEKNRDAAARTLDDLNRFYKGLAAHCRKAGINSVTSLKPGFLKDYVVKVGRGAGPPTVKATVWALRKLGAYLAMVQILPDNPAKDLHHPKMSRREKLPKYLSERLLRQLLETAARRVNDDASGKALRDFAILSLFATTGLRPHEVESLQKSEICVDQHRIDLHVKGGWIKKTPLSAQMANILRVYMRSRRDRLSAAFLNDRGKPVKVSWVQRMVRTAGEDAGLEFRLTCKHLRHTFATHAADRHGKTITRALLGHRRSEATDVYTHLSPRRFRSLMNLHPYQTVIFTGAMR